MNIVVDVKTCEIYICSNFKDTWELAGRPDPVSTCRFNTRIDYVYATPSLLDEYPLVSVKHVDDRASDHNMVVAKFKL